MVAKHQPAASDKVSTTLSPMAAAAKLIKSQSPDDTVVFIGPCVGKKEEARSSGLVDYVLTFEEVAAILVGADINVAAMDEEPLAPGASRAAANFARAGGVTQAVAAAIAHLAPAATLKPERAEGLGDCHAAICRLEKGEGGNFLEGMACPGGCVGGPGALVDPGLGGKLVELYAGTAAAVAALDNPQARQTAGTGDDWHRH
jgi:iron only hydrogenase large subunit-like protein